MNRRQGLVIERKGKRTTVMTSSGEFLTLALKDEAVLPGDTVLLPGSFATGFFGRRLVPAAALAAVMVIASFFAYQGYLMARPSVAYITLDSYGSIELEVNDKGLVKRATGLDGAGTEILKGVSFRLKPVEQVFKSLMRAQDLRGIKNMVIALVPAIGDQKVTGLEDVVAREVEKELWGAPFSSADYVPVSMVTLDLDAREEARSLGISAGRAASWALSDPLNLQSPVGGSDSQDLLENIRNNMPVMSLDLALEHEEPEQFVKDLTKQWIREVDCRLKNE